MFEALQVELLGEVAHVHHHITTHRREALRHLRSIERTPEEEEMFKLYNRGMRAAQAELFQLEMALEALKQGETVDPRITCQGEFSIAPMAMYRLAEILNSMEKHRQIDGAVVYYTGGIKARVDAFDPEDKPHKREYYYRWVDGKWYLDTMSS